MIAKAKIPFLPVLPPFSNQGIRKGDEGKMEKVFVSLFLRTETTSAFPLWYAVCASF